jgi:DNA polymerase-3 subunit epsilon
MSLFREETAVLSSGFPEKMVLLDCETTGSKPTYHRITEIGLIVIENGQVIETWESLIQSDQLIPQHIQNLTGINNDMLSKAPYFSDIANLLMEKLQGRVFTAHNARFDYGFIKNEFSRLGISYRTDPLCSVKLSCALYPQFKRHGLDQIIQRYRLRAHQRHRAFDDARMIHEFFLHSSRLFEADEIASVCDQIRERSSLPIQLSPKIIDSLPKQPGVYYFHDDKGKLLYVGKSINIRNRVLNHFSQDYKNHKDLKMSSRIADVSFQVTASDFSAQILESQEIKQLLPLYNHRLRKVKKLYRLLIELNDEGYAIPVVKEQAVSADIENNYGLFRSYRQIESKLKQLSDEHQLCFRLLGLEGQNTSGLKACFRFQLKKCSGACCGQEDSHTYNARLMAALQAYQQKVWPWPDAILLQERNERDESIYHLIKDWVYLSKMKSPDDIYDLGYAFNTQVTSSFSEMKVHSAQQNDVHEINQFDLDTYFILIRFLLNPELMRINRLTVHPLSSQCSA